MGMVTLPLILLKAQTLVSDIQSLIPQTPTHFGPAVLISITPMVEFPNITYEYQLVFGPSTPGGPNLTLSPETLPAGVVNPTSIGGLYEGDYVIGSGPGLTDTITNFAPAAIAVDGFLIGLASGTTAPFPYTFLSVSGSGRVVVNLGAALTGVSKGVEYKFSYIPASINGTPYDQIVSAPVQVT